MDDLTGLLDGPRARGAFLLRCVLERPWAIRLDDGAPLSLTAVLEGAAWVRLDAASDPVRLDPGDLVVRSGPESWVLADGPRTPVSVVIGPDQGCSALDGRPLVDELGRGVRTWGHGTRGDDVLLTGVYVGHGEVAARLLRVLPPVLVVRAADLDSPLVGLLAAESARDLPGQSAVLDRLLDLLLVSALRGWLGGVDTPPSYAALADPVVGPAVRLMQQHPEQPWTVAGLARSRAMSRAAFARRFTEVVGVAPMTYLTRWRLDVAADLLLAGDATLASVAHQVGYATPYALSTAFRRVRGESPREHRARAGAGARPDLGDVRGGRAARPPRPARR